MADTRVKQPKGVKLDHISKIYKEVKRRPPYVIQEEN